MLQKTAKSRLRAYLVAVDKRGTRLSSQIDFGARIGVSQQTVSKWAKGSKVPGHLYRRAIEAATGIPADDWAGAEERKLRRLVVAAEVGSRRRRSRRVRPASTSRRRSAHTESRSIPEPRTKRQRRAS